VRQYIAVQILVSAASGWEMAIKNKTGKLDVEELLQGLETALDEEGFSVLPISIHALRAGSPDLHHKDPFRPHVGGVRHKRKI
jgi:PIN domain nuclease of toxin-antitoxin system